MRPPISCTVYTCTMWPYLNVGIRGVCDVKQLCNHCVELARMHTHTCIHAQFSRPQQLHTVDSTKMMLGHSRLMDVSLILL